MPDSSDDDFDFFKKGKARAHQKPVPKAATPSRTRRAVAALLAMVIAVLGLFLLDAMRPPPEPISVELKARRAMALAEMQSAVTARNAATELEIEVRRNTANAMLNLAIQAEKDNRGAQLARMERLHEWEGRIQRMYGASRADTTGQPPNAKATLPQALSQAVEGADELEQRLARLDGHKKDDSWLKRQLDKFVDTESPLNLVYKAVVVALIGMFAVGGLTLLFMLAEQTGLKPEKAPEFGSEKKSSNNPELPLRSAGAHVAGTLATAGITAVGTAFAITVAMPADAARQQNSPIADRLVMASQTAHQQHNTVNTSGAEPGSPIEVNANLTNVPVDLKASPEWTSSTNNLLSATTHLSDSTKNLAQLGNEMRGIAELLKTKPEQAARLDLNALVQQTTLLAKGTNELVATSTDANSRFYGLARQVLANDCYARESDAMIMAGTVHTGSMSAGTSARIGSGKCALPQTAAAADRQRAVSPATITASVKPD